MERRRSQKTEMRERGRGRVGLPVDFQYGAKVRLVLACLSAFTEKHS